MREAPGRVFVGGRELLQPNSVLQAAKQLSLEWAAQGYHEDSESIRARYYKLKKARVDPKAVKKSL